MIVTQYVNAILKKCNVITLLKMTHDLCSFLLISCCLYVGLCVATASLQRAATFCPSRACVQSESDRLGLQYVASLAGSAAVRSDKRGAEWNLAWFCLYSRQSWEWDRHPGAWWWDRLWPALSHSNAKQVTIDHRPTLIFIEQKLLFLSDTTVNLFIYIWV